MLVRVLTAIVGLLILSGCASNPLRRPFVSDLDERAQARWRADTAACGGVPDEIMRPAGIFGGPLGALVVMPYYNRVAACLTARGWETFPQSDPDPVVLKRP